MTYPDFEARLLLAGIAVQAEIEVWLKEQQPALAEEEGE